MSDEQPQVQQPQVQQPQASTRMDAEPPQDRPGLRVLLWAGRIVVALVYVYAILAAIVLGFRFFLLLFAASPDAAFSEWIYETSAQFMQPFAGMIEIWQPTEGVYLDVGAIFALIFYAIIALLVHMLYETIRHKLYVEQRHHRQATK